MFILPFCFPTFPLVVSSETWTLFASDMKATESVHIQYPRNQVTWFFSVTQKSLHALVLHLYLTELCEVGMPYSDMWQDCQITFLHTRPCCTQVKLSVSWLPDPTWKHPPGRPCAKWTDQRRQRRRRRWQLFLYFPLSLPFFLSSTLLPSFPNSSVSIFLYSISFNFLSHILHLLPICMFFLSSLFLFCPNLLSFPVHSHTPFLSSVCALFHVTSLLLILALLDKSFRLPQAHRYV